MNNCIYSIIIKFCCHFWKRCCEIKSSTCQIYASQMKKKIFLRNMFVCMASSVFLLLIHVTIILLYILNSQAAYLVDEQTSIVNWQGRSLELNMQYPDMREISWLRFKLDFAVSHFALTVFYCNLKKMKSNLKMHPELAWDVPVSLTLSSAVQWQLLAVR